MSRNEYIHRSELAANSDRWRQECDALRAVIVELAAAVMWIDKNGYQNKMLARTLEAAKVKPDDVIAFNDAKKARIAEWRDKQAGA